MTHVEGAMKCSQRWESGRRLIARLARPGAGRSSGRQDGGVGRLCRRYFDRQGEKRALVLLAPW